MAIFTQLRPNCYECLELIYAKKDNYEFTLSSNFALRSDTRGLEVRVLLQEGDLIHPLADHDGPVGGIEAEKDHGQHEAGRLLHVGRVLVALGALGLKSGEAEDISVHFRHF